jgi:hypothetical protein
MIPQFAHAYWGWIPKKHGVWDPMPELNITSPYVCPLQSRLQHIYHGQPFARVDLNPMPESNLSRSQGLWIWPLKTIFSILFLKNNYVFFVCHSFLIWYRMEQTCSSSPSSTPPTWRSLAPFKSWVSCPQQDRVRFPRRRNSEWPKF